MIAPTDHLSYGFDPNASPGELANHALATFFNNFSLEECQGNLWYFLKYAFSGKLSSLGTDECLNLMTFLEQLNEALVISHKAYGRATKSDPK